MNIKSFIFATTVSCLLAAPLSAKEKTFYDSKSNIVCIAGNYELLEYGNKFRKVEVSIPQSYSTYTAKQIEETLNSENYGKKILDYLFSYNGSSLSEDRLKDLALQNVLKSDDERASIGVISKDDILKEDYLPILENNYIFIVNTKKGKKRWNVYKVMINKDVLDQVFNSWNDMDKYNQIKVPLFGKGKFGGKPKAINMDGFIKPITQFLSQFGLSVSTTPVGIGKAYVVLGGK
jgi:hypothetical protein